MGSDRYPETRMGTEQIIADRFRMARDYEARWNEWNETQEGIPPRRDLRMDALVVYFERRYTGSVSQLPSGTKS